MTKNRTSNCYWVPKPTMDVLKGFKILCLFNSYYVFNSKKNPISGGEKRFFEVIRIWNRQGHDIEVLTSAMGQDTCLKNQLNVKYIILPLKMVDRMGVVGAYSFRAIMACVLALKFRGKMITYSATDIISDIIPVVMVKVFNKNSKMVCTIFHLIPPPSVRVGSKIRNLVSIYSQRISHFFIKRFADIIFVDNTILRHDLIKQKFPSEKIVVISMGIDKAYIDRISPSSLDKYDACFLGRLHISKGIFDLPEIWRLVVEKKKNAKLVVVGETRANANQEVFPKLKEKIKDYGLENNISFLGFLTTEDVYKTLKSSKVLIFPSHEEGWGISVCEAMACRLPVVAYDLPALREVFPKGMVRIKMGDYQAFSHNILELLSNKSKYDELSKDAVSIASQYSWEEAAAKELSHLRNVVEGDKR